LTLLARPAHPENPSTVASGYSTAPLM